MPDVFSYCGRFVYNDAVIKDLGLRRLSYDAALGFTEYSVPLPVSLLGHKRAHRAVDARFGRHGHDSREPADDSAGGVVTADFRQPFVLRLGRWPSGRSDDEKARCVSSGLFL